MGPKVRPSINSSISFEVAGNVGQLGLNAAKKHSVSMLQLGQETLAAATKAVLQQQIEGKSEEKKKKKKKNRCD